MALEHEGPAPYTSPSSVIHVVQRFRERGLQTPFDVDVLIRAGISEGLAPRTHQALKQMDLIDESGEPTEALRGLQRAPAEEYRARFAEVVRAAYAPVFQYTDPAQDPLDRVRDAFRPYTPIGQQGRMVTLFMGLCEHVGIVQTRPKAGPKPGAVSRRSVVTAAKVRADGAGTARASVGRHEALATQGNAPQAILALVREALPAAGSTWTTSQREAFMRTFATLLDFYFPVDDTSQEVAVATAGVDGGDGS